MLRILDREFRRYYDDYDDYDEEEEEPVSRKEEMKPLSDDIAYPLISWFAREKEEKHFSWDGKNIWPYKRGLGVGIHIKYSSDSVDDESRKAHAENIKNTLNSVVKGGFFCWPADLEVEATVGSEVPEIDEIKIPYISCSSKYEFSSGQYKKAWAIAFTFAKKANASDLGKEYAVVPDVWNCGGRKYTKYCLGVKLLPRSEISRFRSWLSSLVEKVKGEEAPTEEDIEGRIASLI